MFCSRLWLLSTSTSILLSLLASLSHARQPDGRPHRNIMRVPTAPAMEARANTPVVGRDGKALPNYSTVYYFDQLVDHNKPSLGTFRQRYWFTAEFYQRSKPNTSTSCSGAHAEIDGPIILYTPGETNALQHTGYLTNATLPGMIGMGIVPILHQQVT